MAKETAVGKFIQDTPQWAKGVIAVAAIGAGYLIYRGISKKASGQGAGGTPESKLPSNLNQDLATAAKKSPLSYPLSQYDIWANQLKQAMFDWGTNEEAIFSVFSKMKNDADVLQLIKSFGVWKIEARYGIPLPFETTGTATLGEALIDELSSSDIGIINKTLASKKNPSITIRF